MTGPVRAAARAVGCDPTPTMVKSPREPARLILRCERAREELAFAAAERFEDGVREEADWLAVHLARAYGR